MKKVFRTFAILLTISVLLIGRVAHAQFNVCNQSRIHTLALAWVHRDFWGLVPSPIAGAGWFEVSPGSCLTIQGTSVETTEAWVLAMSEGYLLPTVNEPWSGSPVDESGRDFCVSPKDAFNWSGDGSCVTGQRKAVFPVHFAFSKQDGVGEFTLNLNPDKYVGKGPRPRDPLSGPAYFVALAQQINDPNRFSYSGISRSAEEADQSAMEICGACHIVLRISDQCMALAGGNVRIIYLKTPPGSSLAETEQAALNRCAEAGIQNCHIYKSLCATAQDWEAARQALFDKGLKDLLH